MRNLKRALSLVLATAMLIGMMVLGASAAGYKDDSAITNDEAVEVLTAIGVVGGDENGDFRPESTLTRAEFCVMIANVLTGGKFDKTLFEGTSTPFVDTQGHWGAPFIAFCYSSGTIAGTSATTFSPDATLTAAQAEAILLCALGYNQNGEFAANGQFELNVATWAKKVGLMDNLSVAANAPISRDNTAKLVFNAVTNAVPVEYNDSFGVYYNALSSGMAWSAGVVYKYEETLGYTNFKLVRQDNASDDFARPAVKWLHNSRTIGTYDKTADYTYTTKVNNGDIYNDIGEKIAADDITIYVDGVEKTTGDEQYAFDIVRGGKTTVGDSGNGVLTEVFYDKDNGTVKIVQINTYVGEVAAVRKATDSRDAYITIEGKDAAKPANADLTYNTEEFEENAVVLYTYSASEKKVESVELAETVSGTVTRYETKDNVAKITADGVVYSSSAKYANEIGDVEIKTEYDLYLDNYGYVILVKAISDLSSDYALVLQDSGGATSDTVGDELTGDANLAKLVFADGTVRVVDTDETYNLGGIIVTYRVNDDYTYTLRAAGGKVDNTLQNGKAGEVAENGIEVKDVIYDKDFSLIQDNALITLTTETGAQKTTYANSETVFVVYDGAAKEWSAYTGIKNAPDITAAGTANSNANTLGVASYVYEKGGIAKIVFIQCNSGVEINGSSNSLFIVDHPSNRITDVDGDYYEYPAIVNGEIVTIKVDASAKDSITDTGFYGNSSLNSKDIYTRIGELKAEGYDAASAGEQYIVELGIKKSAAHTITTGDNNSSYTVAADADVFYVDEDSNITVSSYGAISKDDNDVVYALVKDYMIQTLVIVAKDDGGNEGPATGSVKYVLKDVKFGDDNASPLQFTVATSKGEASNAEFTWIVTALNTTSGTTYVADSSDGRISMGDRDENTIATTVLPGSGIMRYTITVVIDGVTLTKPITG